MEFGEVIKHVICGEEVLSDRVREVTIVLVRPLSSSHLWSHQQHVTFRLVRGHDPNRHLDLLEIVSGVKV